MVAMIPNQTVSCLERKYVANKKLTMDDTDA